MRSGIASILVAVAAPCAAAGVDAIAPELTRK
jgi:hypothetical protein